MKDFRSRILTDDQRSRLYREHPHLKNEECPTCEGTKTYLWAGEIHDCDCEYQIQLHRAYLWAGIGITYQRLDWEDFDGPQEAAVQLTKYVENHKAYIKRGRGLMLVGPYGSGKTMLANLALKWFVRDGYHCYATTFAATVEMFTAGWKAASEQRYFQDRFVGSDVLLLDDVGRELKGSTKLSETTFDSILRTRVQSGRPTFITTNLGGDELEQGYGSAVLSLLKEKSNVLTFEGEDFRAKANKRERDEIERGETRPIL